jgi:hypothetical protein
MLNQQTLDKMNAMKLAGMVDALRLQLGSAEHTRLSFDERLGLMIDAEWTARELHGVHLVQGLLIQHGSSCAAA